MVTGQDKPTGEEGKHPDAVADFEQLLKDYGVKKSAIIAKNISETGGAKIFDDPEAMAKKLAKWPRDITPVYREQILEHWFKSRGITVPKELIEETGLGEGEKTEKDKEKQRKKKLSEGAVWTVDVDSTGVPRIRMIKDESEPGITLEDARVAAREIGKEGQEPLAVFNEQLQKHMPNFKSTFVKQNLNAAWAVAKQMDKAMAEGTEVDPIDLWIDMEAKKQQFMQVIGATGSEVKPSGTVSEIIQGIRDLKEMAGEGKVDMPDWMTDPVKFIATVQAVTGTETKAGGKETPEWMTDPAKFVEMVRTISVEPKGDEGLKTELAELRKAFEAMIEQRHTEERATLQAQIKTLADNQKEMMDYMTELKRPVTGMTEMDILNRIATEGISLARAELPGLRGDLREALRGGGLPAPKTAQEREERKAHYRESLDKDKDIESIGKRLFFPEVG